jgi:hypothetical protein
MSASAAVPSFGRRPAIVVCFARSEPFLARRSRLKAGKAVAVDRRDATLIKGASVGKGLAPSLWALLHDGWSKDWFKAADLGILCAGCWDLAWERFSIGQSMSKDA